MKFSKQILAFFISTATTTSKGLSTEDIQKAVGDGCSNSFNFRSSFVTDNGSTCDTCVFCDGSRLSSLFDPKIENVCIDCGTADNDCKNLEVATDFVTPWLMEFITLTSSAMGSENDPSGIVLKGSTDSNTWEMMYDSQLSFSNRKTDLEFVLNNSKQFKSYSMNFQRKNTSAKMYLGNYKIVQTYTKGCAAKIYGDITGEYVLPYATLAPTESPSISPNFRTVRN